MNSMATGTQRQSLLHEASSKEPVNNWTSFDESPVHAGDGTRTEEGWLSFKESQVSISQSDFNNSLQFPSPVPGYVSKQRVPIISQHQNIAPASQLPESSIMNHSGMGAETPTGHARSQTNIQHPQQSEVATHGPGSTINHLLRHKSADVDKEPVKDDTSRPQINPDSRELRPTNSAGNENMNTPDSKYHPTNRGNGKRVPDPWFVTDEQANYYKNQFSSMQHNLDGKIDGQTARNFFTKSRLPIRELSFIWELCDMDQDGHLTLIEFCAAFHLVVARKNGYDLPPVLPKTLLPPLMKLFGQPTKIYSMDAMSAPAKKSVDSTDGAGPKNVIASPIKVESNSTGSSKDSSELVLPKQTEENTQWVTQQEKWETFSDRTSSSTNLANFDQNLGQNDHLPHPVPLRITPSRHESYSAKMRKDKDIAKSTDDEDHNQLKYTVPPSHKSLTNPYGSLKNDFSEPDSHTSPRVRSSSNSSQSSTNTSDRSISEVDVTLKLPRASDQEYQSDWSSRPLQPRSGSESSISSSIDNEDDITSKIPSVSSNVPTPPPRPHQQVKSSKSDSLESDSHISEDSKIISLSAPTPPPRPQQAAKKPVAQVEEFADFSRFDITKQDEIYTKSVPTTDSSEDIVKSRSDEDRVVEKPMPAPRHSREDKNVKSELKEESSPDRSSHRKPPTKPPRNRIRSVEAPGDDATSKMKISPSLASKTDDLPPIAEKPPQSNERSKSDIQQSIRNLKCRNTKLTKLNADLQEELKNVMQSRITVEMSIHQLRPFSQ